MPQEHTQFTSVMLIIHCAKWYLRSWAATGKSLKEAEHASKEKINQASLAL